MRVSRMMLIHSVRAGDRLKSSSSRSSARDRWQRMIASVVSVIEERSLTVFARDKKWWSVSAARDILQATANPWPPINSEQPQ